MISENANKWKRGTYCITGHWSGPISPAGNYTALQHREYITNHKLAQQIDELGCIEFTDGTCLFLEVKRKGKGRREKEILAYRKLIRDCLYSGTNKVADLIK